MLMLETISCLSKIVDPSGFVTHSDIEDTVTRVLSSAGDIITSSEFEERLQTVHSNTIDYVETRISNVTILTSPDLSNYTTRQDFYSSDRYCYCYC